MAKSVKTSAATVRPSARSNMPNCEEEAQQPTSMAEAMAMVEAQQPTRMVEAIEMVMVMEMDALVMAMAWCRQWQCWRHSTQRKYAEFKEAQQPTRMVEAMAMVMEAMVMKEAQRPRRMCGRQGGTAVSVQGGTAYDRQGGAAANANVRKPKKHSSQRTRRHSSQRECADVMEAQQPTPICRIQHIVAAFRVGFVQVKARHSWLRPLHGSVEAYFDCFCLVFLLGT